jgi:hypothetical protein
MTAAMYRNLHATFDFRATPEASWENARPPMELQTRGPARGWEGQGYPWAVWTPPYSRSYRSVSASDRMGVLPGGYSTGSGSAPPIGMPWLSMRE